MSELKRSVGWGGAILLGLGSILGTGVFVSIGIAAGIAGDAVVLAVIIGGLVAVCNGLSSAQLAAAHPVSGGTYAYGYQYLNPTLGFTAGWMFLLAKSASAATAALGFSYYVITLTGYDERYRIVWALVAVFVFTLVVAAGIKRSNMVNALIVFVTLGALLFFIVKGGRMDALAQVRGSEVYSLRELLYASALMFVAYTGYGRIATLGEEVVHPRQTIPKAIIATLLISMLLYIGVVWSGVRLGGAAGFARCGGLPMQHWVITLGAVTAMLGVLLNLILGLSRVLFAMGRRGDFPVCFGVVRLEGATPNRAVYMMGGVIGGLVLIGDVKTTWSFSAFTVLIYYAITNLAALRLPNDQMLYPRIISILGLASCGFLAFWVDPKTWMMGLGLIVVGLVYKSWRGARI